MKLLFTLLLSSIYVFASSAFITPKELHDIINDKNLVLIDTTDKESFKQGHIFNAQQVEISEFRHAKGAYQVMNSSAKIQEVAQSLGINSDSKIVLYGHGKPKELLKASYMALSFIVNGAENVSILDGGITPFVNMYPELLTKVELRLPKGNFVASLKPNVLIDLEYVTQNLNKVPMIEARPLKYFKGEAQSGGVKRLGHITGAQSSWWQEKFNKDETLKTNAQLEEIFIQNHKLQAEQEVITYCTGGLEASMNWYVLSEHLNFKDVKIYDASMREWGNLETTPMEK